MVERGGMVVSLASLVGLPCCVWCRRSQTLPVAAPRFRFEFISDSLGTQPTLVQTAGGG